MFLTQVLVLLSFIKDAVYFVPSSVLVSTFSFSSQNLLDILVFISELDSDQMLCICDLFKDVINISKVDSRVIE
jgi:hypothetical protein